MFEVTSDKRSRYDWIRRTLVRFNYLGCNKSDKGVLMGDLVKVSRYSLAQLKQLLKHYRETGGWALAATHGAGVYPARYSKAAIRLLTAMDERHDTPNGLTMKTLCERAYEVVGQVEYARLTGTSSLRWTRPVRSCVRWVCGASHSRPVNRAICASIPCTKVI